MTDKQKTAKALIHVFSDHILTQNLYDLTVSSGRVKNRIFKIVKSMYKDLNKKNFPTRGKLLDIANKVVLKKEEELKKEKYFHMEERIHENEIHKGNIAKSQASAYRLAQFMNNIPEWKKERGKKDFCYVDIGAGEGTKTLDMRTKLGIAKKDTHCLDLIDTSFILDQESDACIYEIL